jgi:hypothetical protein
MLGNDDESVTSGQRGVHSPAKRSAPAGPGKTIIHFVTWEPARLVLRIATCNANRRNSITPMQLMPGFLFMSSTQRLSYFSACGPCVNVPHVSHGANVAFSPNREIVLLLAACQELLVQTVA